MKVIKRDLTTENFDYNKIKNALLKAFDKCNVINFNIDDIIYHIKNKIEIKEGKEINIEKIQDIVETSLMVLNYYDVAKHYINYRNDRNNKRETWSYIDKIPDNVETKWGQLGYITYKRTYARRINEEDENDDTTEEFHDSILRVLKGCQRQLNTNFTNNELKRAYYLLKSLKGSVAGRFLWQLNTKTVDKLGLMSLQNCAFTKIDKPIRPFLWIFNSLMVGSGIGFNIQKENISKLPFLLDKEIIITRLDTNDADFIIPDSREGWVSLLEKVLEAFYYKGKSFTYSTILIRSKGRKIKGFGGLASGPEELVIGIKNITNILNNKRGQQLSSVDCLDIINIIASIVVSGNVRRCIPKGSLVHTKNGLCNIEDVKVNDEVLTFSGYEKVNNVFKQGEQRILTIKTIDGEFKCTPNHRMAVLTNLNEYGWKKAGNLTKDDILISSRIPIEGVETKLNFNVETKKPLPELTEDIAWLLGVYQTYIYNNNINNDETVADHIIRVRDYTIALKIKKALDLIHNNNVLYYEYNDYCDHLVFCNYDILISYLKSLKTEIPDFIKNAKLNIRLAYIAGIIDINNKDNILSSKSNEYISNIQKFCYSCGFETRISLFKNYYNLEAITIYSQNLINSIPSLINKLIIKENYNTNKFPLNIIQKYHNKFLYNENKKIKLSNYNCTVDYFDNKYIKLNYCPVNIIDIINDNEIVETFDIEVNKKHEFYCNGYLTHNSALVALGDYDDIDYLRAKRWDLGNIPNWRALSNNSVICSDISKLPDEFWNGYNGNGEPYGLINLDLSRKIGRTKDGEKYTDPTVEGYNPCCEISLSNYETCCLSEIFLSNISSYEELQDLAVILYRICKHSLIIKCHEPETEEVVHKNTRMGIGITGYMQSSEEQKSWLDKLYDYLREYDVKYSEKINVKPSIKLTTVKPSGTLSLLAGVTSGAHPAIYQYFIRRIRIASNNYNLINLCKSHGYYTEYQKNFDGTDDKNTMIIEFPCKYPEGCILAENTSAIDQLNVIKELQNNWSDNAVSVTVYYKLDELDDIKKWLLENYETNIKTCSFLLHNEHGFKQAPFEKISKEDYDILISKTKPITNGKIDLLKDNELLSDCVGGACPIR